RLPDSCQTAPSSSPTARKSRMPARPLLEYLLLNHPSTAPPATRRGECYLQDYSFNYGRGYSRPNEPKNIKPDKDYIGDQITLVHRSLHHVYSLRSLHSRSQRLGRTAGRQPRVT
ncbi:MAG UNVERIFIED_CONTAM: hypothetical protein LVR18_51040, partial [Planctomycetaceae bacterium]